MLGHRPTAHPHFAYPVWLTAAQIGTLASVLLCALGIAVYNSLSTWRRRRGSQITLGEDGKEERQPPMTIKEEQDRKIWANVRGMMPENDEPIELEAFWRRAVLQAAGLLLVSLPSFWIIFDNASTLFECDTPWPVRIPAVAYAACTIFQTSLAWSLLRNQRDLARYSSGIQQYCLLTMCAVLSQYALILGPSLLSTHINFLSWMTAAPVLLSFAQFVYSGLMPRGPRHRIDKRHLYTRAVRAALDKAARATAEEDDDSHDPFRHLQTETFGYESVTTERTSCIFAWLAIQWVVPVISVASRLNQIDVQHLPALMTGVRMQNVATELDQKNLIDMENLGKVSVFGLFWRLWKGQGMVLFVWLFLETIRVPLDYVPHASLQMFLGSIGAGSRTMTAVSWAFVLVASKAAVCVLKLVRDAYSITYIQPRTRAHAIFMLYRKLLTRNMFASPEAIKHDVAIAKVNALNLITSDVLYLDDALDTIVQVFTTQLELVLGGIYVWRLLGTSGLWGLSTVAITMLPGFVLSRLNYRIQTKIVATCDERMSLMQEAIQAIAMIKMMATEAFWYRRISVVKEREFRQQIAQLSLNMINGFLVSMGPELILVVSFAHYTLVRGEPLTAAVAFTAINVFSGET